jgi:hypothetical protein
VSALPERPPRRPKNEIQPVANVGSEATIGEVTYGEVVAALDRAWQEIRRRNHEVPPVVLLLGPSPIRRGAKRRTLGYFNTVGWSLQSAIPSSSNLEELRAATRRLEQHVRAGAEAEISRNVVETANTIGSLLQELSREAASTCPEVFIASELITAGAADMFAVLLHEAGHAIATHRNIKDTSRQGRYHNGRFRAIAEEVGLTGVRDPTIGWSLKQLSDSAISEYHDVLAQLDRALSGMPGPRDRAATAAANGPVCGCGNWVPATRRRHPDILAGTVMCAACGHTE